MEGMLSQLSKCNKKIEVSYIDINYISEDDINSNDLFMLPRSGGIISCRLASLIKHSGGFLIYVLDDDLLNDCLKSQPFIYDAWWWRKGLIQTIRISDVLYSFNRNILNKYSQFMQESRTALIDNYFKINSKIKNNSDNNLVKIVYATNPDHMGIFDEIIRPIIPKLIKKYGEKISFTFYGIKPDLDEYENYGNISFYPLMPLNDYRRHIADGNYDIGIAPIYTDFFSRCKYFNKYLEYTIAGIVGVYTRSEPYTWAVKDGYNGFLTENDAESWFAKMCEVIENRELRKNCLEKAINDINVNYNENIYYNHFVEQIPEIIEYNVKRHPIIIPLNFKILRKVEGKINKTYLRIKYIQKDGLVFWIRKKLVERIRNYEQTRIRKKI